MARCPDCQVTPGSPRVPGCDVERCTVCKAQRLSCDCRGHDPLGALWTGEWPGVVECRERGWFVVGPPWVPCTPETPGATEDLNRWSYFVQTGEETLPYFDGR